MSSTQGTALIFGGSRGIGLATAKALGRDGFDVLLTYTSSGDEAIALVADACPSVRVGGVRADVRDPASVAAAFDAAVALGDGRITCVVVNAGINRPPSPVHESDPAVFRELIDVNLMGAYTALREAGRRVEDGGAIIALTTSLVRHAAPGIGMYVAVKAGVEALVRSMARELSPRRIRVNAVAPGPVETDLFNAGKTDEAKARSAAMSPFNRVGQPEEIAEVISFVASPRASWVQGQIVQPNGGLV
jgi:3-oxoacyl-[acyl-carrier protein] reductase